MGQIGAMLADAGTVGMRYAKRLLDSIPSEQFARTASPGGQLVPSNHPAFNVGHLCLYPVKIAELLGRNTDAASAPASYATLFSKDAQCADDPDGSKYPTKDELLQVFQRTYESAFEALRQCDDQQLLAANPVDSPLRNICPTLGSMLAFYAIGHVTSHLGQISTWRRMQGLPAA
ncbi:MAG: DinB family protein [Pirellulaceae bacterium]|nr:DinB family protein [Pirellulaceae bacterium]